MEILDKIHAGDVRAVARAISMVENGDAEAERILSGINAHTGRALVLGLTGPPGSGKSALADRLILCERRRNRKVAVIAVDPSSPFSGGALLGDRLRMQEHATDPDVFIRSMASRGHLGGIARSTGDTVRVLDAAGYDTIIIETVGVGQAEVEIATLSDIVLLVLVPGTGDDIQMMKAGIMEIGDIFVINKMDLAGADRLKTEVEYVLNLEYRDKTREKRPVVMVSALADEGVAELHETVHATFERMAETGLLVERRKRRHEQEQRGETPW